MCLKICPKNVPQKTVPKKYPKNVPEKCPEKCPKKMSKKKSPKKCQRKSVPESVKIVKKYREVQPGTAIVMSAVLLPSQTIYFPNFSYREVYIFGFWNDNDKGLVATGPHLTPLFDLDFASQTNCKVYNQSQI